MQHLALAVKTIGPHVCVVAANRVGRMWYRPIESVTELQAIAAVIYARAHRTTAEKEPKVKEHRDRTDHEYTALRDELKELGFVDIMRMDRKAAEWVYENKIPIWPLDQLIG